MTVRSEFVTGLARLDGAASKARLIAVRKAVYARLDELPRSRPSTPPAAYRRRRRPDAVQDEPSRRRAPRRGPRGQPRRAADAEADAPLRQPEALTMAIHREGATFTVDALVEVVPGARIMVFAKGTVPAEGDLLILRTSPPRWRAVEVYSDDTGWHAKSVPALGLSIAG